MTLEEILKTAKNGEAGMPEIIGPHSLIDNKIDPIKIAEYKVCNVKSDRVELAKLINVGWVVNSMHTEFRPGGAITLVHLVKLK